MHGAVVPIASYTWTTSTTNGTSFTNIPQTYQDLLVVLNISYTGTAFLAGDLPGETSTSESFTFLYGNGSTTFSGRYTNYPYALFMPTSISTSTTNFESIEINFLNYSNTTTYKTYLSRWANDQNGSGDTGIHVGKNASTTAITSLSFSTANGGVYVRAGSTVNLYGIRTVGQ